ncbi:MAG TPA: hypothetical protein PKH89_08760 [Anaerolineae bacterium]|nr:hypothetical protein [Anaerolineae bacterium]
MDKHRNPERTGLIVGVVLLGLGIALMLLPSLIGLSGMDGGYAFSFLGFFLIVCGVIVGWIFWARFKRVERILSGDDVIASWSYDPEEGHRLAREAFEERWSGNKRLFAIVAVLMVVIGFVVLVLPMLQDEDLAWPFVLAYFLLIPVIGLVAWLAPRAEYRQALRDANDVLIARSGVYVRGALHSWADPGSTLEQVTFEVTNQPPELVFVLTHLSGVGGPHSEPEALRLAVPEGHEQDAERVAAYFSSRGR